MNVYLCTDFVLAMVIAIVFFLVFEFSLRVLRGRKILLQVCLHCGLDLFNYLAI